MLFKFNEEEQQIIDTVHDFCVKEVAPIAAEIDENERFPVETKEKLAKLGMMGIPFPKEYGGGGHSYLAYIAACEEISSAFIKWKKAGSIWTYRTGCWQ